VGAAGAEHAGGALGVREQQAVAQAEQVLGGLGELAIDAGETIASSSAPSPSASL
jgi:hypothetical protein